MFIENLRSVKKKWKVPALILIVLLVLGLLSSFAYLGSSFGGMGSGNNAEGLDYYATAAENAEKAVKKNSEDADTLLAAVQAYDDYATYQVLYLDNGSAASYGKMKEYGEKLLALYGAQETEDADWANAYMFVIRADLAVDNVDGAREAFNQSLTAMTLTSEYLNNYSSAMMAKELYTELAEDMNAAAAVLEPLAGEDEEAAEEGSEGADDDVEAEEGTGEEAEAETASDVLAAAQSNAQYAQMMASMNTDDNTTPSSDNGGDQDSAGEDADAE